jgi:hypothetical protein
MLILSGICFAIAVCGIFSDSSKVKKHYLFIMDMAAAIMMLSDRAAYIYRGDTSTIGFWMVRISNFLVFFLTLIVIVCFNGYLIELLRSNNPTRQVPKRLLINKFILLAGVILLVVSQFTGLYYTFDDQNRYQRSVGYMICYMIPLIVWIICISILVQRRRDFNRRLFVALILFCTLPIVGSVAQYFLYGISLTNILVTLLAVFLRVVELDTARYELEQADIREKELTARQQESMQRLFEQTATALVNAIDAKDTYTHGHSARVAEYSKKLAEMKGKTPHECDVIYYTALVHDVGKIGVPESIINKDSRLTDEEYEIIKQHPSMGGQIRSSSIEGP